MPDNVPPIADTGPAHTHLGPKSLPGVVPPGLCWVVLSLPVFSLPVLMGVASPAPQAVSCGKIPGSGELKLWSISHLRAPGLREPLAALLFGFHVNRQ